MATGRKNGLQKRGLARLTLFVAMELLTAACAASTNRVILNPVSAPYRHFFPDGIMGSY